MNFLIYKFYKNYFCRPTNRERHINPYNISFYHRKLLQIFLSDEPYSPEDSDPESTTTPVVKTPPSKTTASVPPPPAAPPVIKADLAAVLSTLKSASFLDPPAVTSFEPFNNKFDAIPGTFCYFGYNICDKINLFFVS